MVDAVTLPENLAAFVDENRRLTIAGRMSLNSVLQRLQGEIDGLASLVQAIADLDSDVANVLESKADKSLLVTGAGSIDGGLANDLSENRSFQLVNDQDAPPGKYVYGTDAAGVKGWVNSLYLDGVQSINDQTGVVVLQNTETVSTATRDLIQADRDKYLRFTYSGAKSYTVRPNATEAITQDSVVYGRNANTGDLTLVAGSGVTINLPPNGSLVIPVNADFQIERVAEDVWDLFSVPVVDLTEAVTALSIASGVVNIDCSLGKHFTLALTANVTSITFSNLPASGKAGEIAVRIQQDGTGSRTVALPTSFKATGGSDTAVQSAASAYTLLTAITFDQGTRWEYAMQEIAA